MPNAVLWAMRIFVWLFALVAFQIASAQINPSNYSLEVQRLSATDDRVVLPKNTFMFLDISTTPNACMQRLEGLRSSFGMNNKNFLDGNCFLIKSGQAQQRANAKSVVTQLKKLGHALHASYATGGFTIYQFIAQKSPGHVNMLTDRIHIGFRFGKSHLEFVTMRSTKN